jgi:FAD/FMN-containing dehydrogenase
MTAEIDELVCSLGGRFYPAKDSTVSSANFQRALPSEHVTRFIALKSRLDPENRLQSDLYRRLFEDGPPNPGLLKP